MHSLRHILLSFYTALCFIVAPCWAQIAPEDDEPMEEQQAPPEATPEQKAPIVVGNKELDETIGALEQEIAILDKTLKNRMVFRQQMLHESDLFYVDYTKKVEQITMILYALDTDKIFTLSFYCKSAEQLVIDYFNTKPKIALTRERITHDISRIDILRSSLQKIPEKDLTDAALNQRNESVQICNNIQSILTSFQNNLNDKEKEFVELDKKMENLKAFSSSQLEAILRQVFTNPSNIAKYIFADPAKMYEYCKLAWKNTEESKLQITYSDNKLQNLTIFLGCLVLGCYFMAFAIIKLGFKSHFESANNIKKIYPSINVLTIALIAVGLLIIQRYIPSLLVNSALTLTAEYLILIAAVFLSIVMRFEYGKINTGVKVYAPYLLLGGCFMVLRGLMAPNIIVIVTMPIVFSIIALYSILTLFRQRKKLPRLDRFFCSVSLLLTLVGSFLSWMGFSFMAFLILMTWIMLMTSILLLVGMWNVMGHIEDIRKKQHKQDIVWFRPFVTKFFLPCLTVALILFSLIWPAGVFDMGNLIIDGIYKSVRIKDILTISGYTIIVIIFLGITVNYLIFLGKNTLKEIYGANYDIGGIPTLVTISTLVLWCVYIFVSMVILDGDYSGILMVMGGMSMGIGFALKDTIDNLVSGLSLMFGRLRQGDMIECDGIRGKVSSVGYRSTLIETIDGSIIAFQNSQLFNKNFRNMTKNHQFECVKVEVGIAYGEDVQKARRLILDATSNMEFLSRTKNTNVVLDSFGDSSVNLGVWVWIPVLSKATSLSIVREKIYDLFNKNNICIPFPQQDIYIKELPNKDNPQEITIEPENDGDKSDNTQK